MSDLKFRSSIRSTFLSAILLYSWFFVAIPLFFWWIESFGNLKYSVAFVSTIFSSVIIVFCAIASIYYTYVFQIKVKSSGIYAYDFTGNGNFVAWEEIERIEPYRFVGCKYLRLFFYNSTVPLWIPLFLVEQQKFERAIIQFTAKTNPLHIALLNVNSLFTDIAFHGKSKSRLQPKNNSKQSKLNNFLELNSVFPTKNAKNSPWMENNVFFSPPEANSYGYCAKEKLVACSRLSLIENIKSDRKKLINLVWTPETNYLVAPEEISWLNDALYAREKRHFQQALQGDLINCLVWGYLFYLNLNESSAVRQIMLFNWIAISIIPAIEHGWGLYQSRSKTPQRLKQNSQQNRYAAWVRSSHAPWTKMLVACVSLVAIVQIIVFFIPQIASSIETAGIIKPAIWEGEVWRLLTGTLLHGNVLHFMFNIFALLVLSKLVEVVTHRLYVPLVFLIAALSGSLFSLLLIPDIPSVGASGGIMGLLGFLFVLGSKHKHLFPITQQQMLAKAAIYTFFAGLLAYEVIDNPAHLGGFLAGIFLGWQLIPHQKYTIPMKQVPRLVKVMGTGSAIIIAIATLFTIYKMILV